MQLPYWEKIQPRLHRWRPLKNVLLFAFLIISFHYLFILWDSKTHLYPFEQQVKELFAWASMLLLDQSIWILYHIFRLDFFITLSDQSIHVQAHNGEWVSLMVSPGCTSLKQWMHWLFLMILFPGPLKHKLWYIPAGLIIIEWVNVIRVVGLTLSLIQWPDKFHFFHDYIFKTFFYFMIFIMWVFWVSFFVQEKKPEILKN